MSTTNYFGSSYTPQDITSITDELAPIDTTHFGHFDTTTSGSSSKYTWQIESPVGQDMWTLKYEWDGTNGDWGHNSEISWYHSESSGVITIYDGSGIAQISFTEANAFQSSGGQGGQSGSGGNQPSQPSTSTVKKVFHNFW